MAQKLQQQLKELGSKLESPPASKDALIRLLKQGATCLSQVQQTPPKAMMESMQPLLNALAEPQLLKHHDREVKLFVAACISEITRITAPEAPYDDDALKDVFCLIVSTFRGLSDTNSPSFGRRVVILETVARYRSCVVMLDLECDDLINELFHTFFAVARDEHAENVLNSMQLIMEALLEESEDVPENLLLVLLSVLGPDKEGVTMAARKLAMNVIKHCSGKLEPGIKQFIVSSMSGDSKSLKFEINYHDVLYDIYRCAPQILSGVVLYLTGELLSDQLDVRLKAVRLVGDLFALPGSTITEAFQPVFQEFLKRLTDRMVEVRLSVLEHVKRCLLANPFRDEAAQIISALCDRLLDYDENVRKQVVSVVCDVACRALTSIPVETINLVSERLRDKSVLVKSHTMERLADVYRVFCKNRSAGSIKNDEYDWIIGRILRCFYDKDFRSDAIEPILSLSLFPADFSVKEKVSNWVRIFSVLDKVEVKALEKILEQKQRLQQEMQKYLSLRQLSQEGDEIPKKKLFCFRVMSRCFADSTKAEEDFQILDHLKDLNIWKILTRLLDPSTSFNQAHSSRDDLIKIIGEKHGLYEFLKSLSLKSSHLLFDKDHVREILLEAGVQKSLGNNELILSCMTILVILARFCPLLLGGSEEDLVRLLEDDNEIMKEGTLHILAKAGVTIREQLGVSSRSLDLILERICIEGSRRQAKYAVHALASITKDDGLMSLSVLYKTLVDMLGEKQHLPAVLQSLGCIAEAAMPVFETREAVVEKFIKENILEIGHTTEDKASDSWDDRSELCSLKIFGLKALVKSYLPVKDAHLRSGIDGLIEVLKNILSYGDISREIESNLIDRAHLKLAAAKSILRLSRHWGHKIPVEVFYLTLTVSYDKFPEVQKLLLDKIHQYIKDRNLDPKYACAFLLDMSSHPSVLEENKRNLSDIIQMCRQGRGRQIASQTDGISPALYPEYILTYVVHSLAHHPSFPSIDECKDVKTFEPMYRQLYLFLSMLVYEDREGRSDVSIYKDKETISLLNSIFLCIKGSEDAFDSAKSKNSYALCDLGISIIKRLAPNPVDSQESTASVTLPLGLYKPLEKKEENETPAGEQKTWLADESILAHFESLELESNRIVNSEIIEDDVMKESETEASEMPLAKLMKLLKAKGAKARKEVKDEPGPAGVINDKDFDILKMVKEINSGNLGKPSKFETSNGHENLHKKRRSDQKPRKRKILFSESTDICVPKRRRTPSSQAQKSMKVKSSKNSKMLTKADTVTADVDDNEKIQTGSDNPSMQKGDAESAESDSFVISVKRKLSTSSRQKGKRSGGDNGKILNSTDAKKPKKGSETDDKRPVSDSYSRSTSKQKGKSVGGLGKCTTKDDETYVEDLVGCKIKVYWPMDKQFYQGMVKSFDKPKNRHVILYDDGDVEILALDKERWELIENDKHSAKRLGLSKGSRSKGGSSAKKRAKAGSSKQDEGPEEKPLSSQVRGKRTPRKGPKQKGKTTLKTKSPAGRSRSVGDARPKSSKKTVIDDPDSDERNEKVDETLSEEMSDAEQKAEENDSEDTLSDHVEVSKHDGDELDNEAASSSEKQPSMEEESEMEIDEADERDSHPTMSDKSEKMSSDSDSVYAELSDDEPLSIWKQRAAKK